jgi:hypothetical protein
MCYSSQFHSISTKIAFTMAARTKISKRELDDVLLAQEEASRIVGEALNSEIRGGRSLRARATIRKPKNCYAEALINEAASDHSYEKNPARRNRLIKQSKEALLHAWLNANHMFDGLEDSVKRTLKDDFVEISRATAVSDDDDDDDDSASEAESGSGSEAEESDEDDDESDDEEDAEDDDAEDDDDGEAEESDEDDDEDEDDEDESDCEDEDECDDEED